MQLCDKHTTTYVPPTVETEPFLVEEGFSDSVTWQNSFTVEPAGENKVNLFLWTDQTKQTPTNANEQFDLQWSNDDSWGTP